MVVTLNYRLGPLGFLHLAELGGEAYAASGICGHPGSIAALQWVQDNIAAFGGDPHCITVFGESAGAMSIGTLLAFLLLRGCSNERSCKVEPLARSGVALEATTLRAPFSRPWM